MVLSAILAGRIWVTDPVWGLRDAEPGLRGTSELRKQQQPGHEEHDHDRQPAQEGRFPPELPKRDTAEEGPSARPDMKQANQIRS